MVSTSAAPFRVAGQVAGERGDVVGGVRGRRAPKPTWCKYPPVRLLTSQGQGHG